MPIPEDQQPRCTRPFEDRIKTMAKVLDLEKELGIIMTREEMMLEAMKINRGTDNPVLVREMIDQIFEERGL